MNQKFLDAQERVNSLTSRPQNEELLKLYALYKQATEGNVSGDPPGGFDFKGAAKFNAWKSLEGKSKEEAETEYITLVDELVVKYS